MVVQAFRAILSEVPATFTIMADNVTGKRTWSDSQLVAAVSVSHSWRGVMRELGLCVTAAGSLQAVKRQVGRLGLDTSHFTGQRRWSDGQLRRAVAISYSWRDLASELGLAHDHGDDRVRVKAHAARLGLDLSHLQAPRTAAERSPLLPGVRRLRDSGTAIAAAWFMLCGCNVAFPVEPAHYDLLVSLDNIVERVQVKTTTYKRKKDGWSVSVGRRPYSAGNREPKIPYDPDGLDYFFIVDGELTMYLIPSRVLVGRVSILLRSYTGYVVGTARSLLEPPAA
jgi:hypothetical protein